MPGFISLLTYEISTSGAKARILLGSVGTAEGAPFPKSLFMTLDLFIPLFSIRLGVFQELPQAIQFVGIDAAVLQNIQHQHFVGILKETIGQMANFRAGGFGPLNQGPVNVRAAILYMPEVTLLFEDADGGQHRVISQLGFLRERFEHLLDGRWALLPQHVHEPQLGFSQGCGFGWWQEPSSVLNLLDAMKAERSTNYLVAEWTSLVVFAKSDLRARKGRAGPYQNHSSNIWMFVRMDAFQ